MASGDASGGKLDTWLPLKAEDGSNIEGDAQVGEKMQKSPSGKKAAVMTHIVCGFRV